jgi:tetratricopeptide (TPR) repeat protein
MANGTNGAQGTDRLNGWKAIAAFLRVDVRTARRWEAERALPVHRLPGDSRSPVWADPAELHAWMAPEPGPPPAAAPAPAAPPGSPPAPPRWRNPALVAALAAAAVAALLLVPRAPAVAPPVAAPFADEASNRLWREATHAKSSRTPPGLDAAAAAFTTLAERHPAAAAPRVGLAETYLLMREFAGLPDEAAFRRARDAAEAALRLDPADPAALRALGFTLFWSEADKPRGLALLKRAVETAPAADSRAWHWYGNALAFDGQFDPALEALARARGLAPDSSAIAADEAQVRYIRGDRAAALASLRAITRADPAFIGAWRYLEWNLLAEDDIPGFLEAARAHARLRGDGDRLALLDRAEAAGAAGGRDALLALLIADAKARHQAAGGPALQVARLQALAGDAAETRAWVGRARALGEPYAYMLEGWPEFRARRTDAAFADLFANPPA